MKIKILVTVLKNEIGTLIDLKQGEIIAIDDEIGNKLIDQGKAEIQL